jgi:hypothetical protein
LWFSTSLLQTERDVRGDAHNTVVATARGNLSLDAERYQHASLSFPLSLVEEKKKKHGFAICHIRFVDNCLWRGDYLRH